MAIIQSKSKGVRLPPSIPKKSADQDLKNLPTGAEDILSGARRVRGGASRVPARVPAAERGDLRDLLRPEPQSFCAFCVFALFVPRVAGSLESRSTIYSQVSTTSSRLQDRVAPLSRLARVEKPPIGAELCLLLSSILKYSYPYQLERKRNSNRL